MDPLTKQLAAYAISLRQAGFSEAEIRRSVDQLEITLVAESATDREYAPDNATPKQRAALELERASRGEKALLPKPEDQGPNRTREDQKRDISKARLDHENAERAFNGLAPMTADELRKETLKRANPTLHSSDDDPGTEVAPRGMSAYKREQQNLHRAVTGAPTLIPHPDDEK